MNEHDDDLWLDNIVSLELTQNEVFYLNDRLTMLTFSKRGSRLSAPTRKLKQEAAIGVPFQIIMQLVNGIAQIKDGNVVIEFPIGDLFMIRECFSSKYAKDDEEVGRNLILKVSKLINEQFSNSTEINVSEEAKDQIEEILNKNK